MAENGLEENRQVKNTVGFVTPTKKSRYNDTNGEVKSVTKKRDNYIGWDEYFMSVAFLSAQRSKDPSSQVGACIVNQEKKIVGIGYNGMPNNCGDDELPWGKEGDWLDQKYAYVCHAEMNAIMNKNSSDVKDCTIYVALFPCNECAKLIIQSGIKRIMYLSDKHHDKPATQASKRMLDLAQVEYVKYIPKKHKVVIDFYEIDPESRPRPSSSIMSP
ncbi:deoxycytidylate deaminase-like [Acanthaster planci]|uniref:dCMP deaminase n=1 Tax=Acanthaster planci TaxID=133434 RepID=A0A8B7Y3H5_ACAPL|nr:deoxycytidylate deaminase-like [Acanthaster planci]